MSAWLRWLLLAVLVVVGEGCYFRYLATSPALEGCTYEGTGEKVKGQLFVENYGWYLFDCVPLFCGNDDPDGWFPLSFFSDRCTSEVIESRFNEAVAESGGEARGVAFVNYGTVMFDVPGFSFPVIIPYVLCSRTLQISGTLVEPKKEAQ